MDKPLTAEDVAREWGEEFLRQLIVELIAPARAPETKLALIGLGGSRERVRSAGPPTALHLRAEPIARREWPADVCAEEERELIRLWREELDENMLDALVNAFRPKLVNMAKKLSQRHSGLLIEYGVLGLKIAAGPQRPSKTKKGKLAGFDPSRGFRFITFASRVAYRFMSAAMQAMGGVVIVKGLRDVDDAIVIAGDYFSECLGPRYEDSVEEFREWAKTPIPFEIEGDRVNYVARSDELAGISPRVAMVDYDDFRLWGIPAPTGLDALPGYI
jgi:hypothetical protein